MANFLNTLLHVVVSGFSTPNGWAVPTDESGAVPVDQGASQANIDSFSPYGTPNLCWSAAPAAITDNANHDVKAAVAGKQLVITSLFAQNRHPTQDTTIEFIEETTGTVKWRIYGAALGGGAHCPLPAPIVLTADKKLIAKCTITGADVIVNATGTSYEDPNL